MNTTVKYIAKLTHVREVTLLGAADLGFWKHRLQKESLVPVESEGRAELLIVAADLKFLGVRFQEISFSVLVSWEEHRIKRDGAFLVQAFNSCRLFAFCERKFFWTPYQHGDVCVRTSLPASIQLASQGEVLFHAGMQTVAIARPAQVGNGGWEGPVLLPSQTRNGHHGKFFFARINGLTQTYPFLPENDSMTINPSPSSDLFQALLDSHFTPKEWALREDATHSKSRTQRRAKQ